MIMMTLTSKAALTPINEKNNIIGFFVVALVVLLLVVLVEEVEIVVIVSLVGMPLVSVVGVPLVSLVGVSLVSVVGVLLISILNVDELVNSVIADVALHEQFETLPTVALNGTTSKPPSLRRSRVQVKLS